MVSNILGILLCGFYAHLPLATSKSNVDESAGVCYSLLRTALGGLLLLLRLNLPNDIRQQLFWNVANLNPSI
jgi:hypothetical protein